MADEDKKEKRHDKGEIEFIAEVLVSEGKGILAADWSTSTATKHFEKNGIEPSEENRRRWRQLLFTTKGIEEVISGVIFHEETLRQKTDDGVPFPKYLEELGIIPGIKVDMGAKDMANFPGEKITEGLDGLRDRLKEYYELGAKFTKWRAVITIGDSTPTTQCIRSNAEALARFAALSQEAKMVPIVEPEVLMDGKHPIARDEAVTKQTLSEVFAALEKHKVDLKATILKTGYVHPGKESGQEINYETIAEETIQTLERTVPSDIPGVVFLSGGDSPEESTMHLDAISKKAKTAEDLQWELTFSYARALQYPAIEKWQGKEENKEAVQKEFAKRIKLIGLARQGKYDKSLESTDY